MKMANSKEATKATSSTPATPKRELDDSARVGRLMRTLQRIERERDTELENAPQSINERAKKRMQKAAEGYPLNVVNAARAAVEAMRAKPEAEHDP